MKYLIVLNIGIIYSSAPFKVKITIFTITGRLQFKDIRVLVSLVGSSSRFNYYIIITSGFPTYILKTLSLKIMSEKLICVVRVTVSNLYLSLNPHSFLKGTTHHRLRCAFLFKLVSMFSEVIARGLGVEPN